MAKSPFSNEARQYSPTQEEIVSDICDLYDLFHMIGLIEHLSDKPHTAAAQFIDSAIKSNRYPGLPVRIIMHDAQKKGIIKHITRLHRRFERTRIEAGKPPVFSGIAGALED